MESTKRILKANKSQSSSWISSLFFWWTVPIFKNGYKNSFTEDDLCEPLNCDRANLLGRRLNRVWKIECKRSSHPSLRYAIVKAFWKELTIMGTLCFVNDVVVRLTLPFLLGNLLTYFRKDSGMTHRDALMYGAVMILITVFSGLGQLHFYYNGNHYGMNIRTAVCSLIYRKVLRLSRTALGDTAPGKVVNLLSNDVSRFESAVIVLHSLWTAPLMTIIAGYLLWHEIQWSGMIGMAIVCIFVPFQSYAGKLSSKYRNQTAMRTDERVRFMDEIISGVQVIKMYAWEVPFAALVRFARRKELNIVLKNAYVRAMYMSLSLFTTRMALCATVLSIFLLYDREKITVAKMFVVSALFNAISSGICQTFILAVAQMAEAIVAFERLETFLGYEEKSNKPNAAAKVSSEKLHYMNSNDIAIIVEDASARWLSTFENDEKMDTSNLTLNRVSVTIPKGKLIGVIGSVGAGKSSLLQALLYELPLESGSISINGSISYASQEPWVFAATVRQNILFGKDLDQERYDAVVKCTDLVKDFEQFSDGDMTMIGEGGGSLSGGQKARVNFARAVYRSADIYLLDDPLSAVDAHVGLHLFNKCIGRNGFLANASRILVTHQVHFLQEADWILVLRDGRVEIQGTYDDVLNSGVLNSGIDFASILTKPDLTDNKRSNEVNKTETIKSPKSDEAEVSLLENGTHSKTVEETKEMVPQELESSSKGKIKGSLLLNYFKAANQPILLGILIVLFLLAQILASAADIWVADWTRKEEIRTTYLTERYATDNFVPCSNDTTNCNAKDLSSNMIPTNTYAYIYGGIIVSLFIVAVTRSVLMFRMCVTVSQNLHDNMFKSLIATTMRFFNTNPSGRILNRFSKDIGTIDELLPKTFLDAAQINLSMLGAITVTVMNVNIVFIVIIVIMSVLFTFIRRVYLKTSRDIKRFEGMTKSPVFTHISASLTGLATIRAYNAESILHQEFDNHQDLNTACLYMYMSTGSAFALSLELMVYVFVTYVTSYFLLIDTDATGDRVGLAITQSLTLTGFFKWGVRQSAEVENQLMSVERALEYSNCLDTEKQPDIPIKAALQWPSNGKIEFKNVFYRYYVDSKLVLRGLSFAIQSKEKIGIVGRTGSGKSSLIESLFRLACIDGDILIDDINTAQLDLKDLRSKIAIIPQDPVLFSGTLRRNLDPFNEYSDADIWSALENVELTEVLSHSLEQKVMARGSNFSVGQRQLLCLARAILRRNKILVLDEATANVDPQTDLLIQHTIRTKFANCTVLTVAHRLHTIIDSDRILVMDAGIAIEFDKPFTLLSKSNGIFHGMVESLGPQEFNRLLTISQNQIVESQMKSENQR